MIDRPYGPMPIPFSQLHFELVTQFVLEKLFIAELKRAATTETQHVSQR